MDPMAIATGLAAGLLLGAVHLGGLWLTVRALAGSRVPALLLLGSFAARTALVVAGAAYLAAHSWQALAALAAGFLLARLIATRILGVPESGRNRPAGETPA